MRERPRAGGGDGATSARRALRARVRNTLHIRRRFACHHRRSGPAYICAGIRLFSRHHDSPLIWLCFINQPAYRSPIEIDRGGCSCVPLSLPMPQRTTRTSHPTSARSATSSPAACCGCAAAMLRNSHVKPTTPETIRYAIPPTSAVMRTRPHGDAHDPKDQGRHRADAADPRDPTGGCAGPAGRADDDGHARLEAAMAGPVWHRTTALQPEVPPHRGCAAAPVRGPRGRRPRGGGVADAGSAE